MLIGIAISQFGIRWTAALAMGGSLSQFALGLLVFVLILWIGIQPKGFIQTIPLAIGLIVGYIIGIPLGFVNFSAIAQAQWIGFPQILPLGTPKFDLSAIIIFMISSMISLIESIGDYHAMGAVTNTEITKNIINRGIGTEGFTSCISGFFGSSATTSLSQYVGLIKLTRVAARFPMYIAVVTIILMGFIPKIAAFFVSFPPSVIGGVLLATGAMVFITGFDTIRTEVKPFERREMAVIGVAITVGLGTLALPNQFISQFPRVISSILNSVMASGVLTALLAEHVIFRKKRLRTNPANKIA
jgi:xanthine/uracil permease